MDQSWETLEHVIIHNHIIICSILNILHNIVQPGKLFLGVFVVPHHPVDAHELLLVIQMFVKD